MALALCLAAGNPSAASIEKLWDAAAAYESTPSLRAVGYPPHLTLAIWETTDVSEEAARAALARAVAGEQAIRLRFTRIASFDADPLILWLAPNPSPVLSRIHRAVHAIIDPTFCHPHYRPDGWIPHCTLATRIPADRRADALAFAARFDGDIDAVFDRADCLTFPPVSLIESHRLPPSAESSDSTPCV
ncbi:2'-5' RNA ligase family protein [Terrarubrum flagellatum]|uniref:2'-5' RNA ligase family protein n=1 Tax=Terrirubrum flagellatum TaxID=2895980 RepID=UPI003144D630